MWHRLHSLVLTDDILRMYAAGMGASVRTRTGCKKLENCAYILSGCPLVTID
jgi:hypothetical protein